MHTETIYGDLGITYMYAVHIRIEEERGIWGKLEPRRTSFNACHC